MKKYINGQYIELTQAEIEQQKNEYEQNLSNYWNNAEYGQAINSEIRKKYTESQEFAILRQKDDKPEEYMEYYDYCEKCKAYVKEQKQKYGGEYV